MGTNKMLRLLQMAISSMVDGGAKRLIFARPQMSQAMMPSEVRIESRPVSGKRVVRKDNRRYANQRLNVADWPDDNLQELAVPRFSCMIEGEVSYLIEKYKIYCGEGNIILIPPHIRHQRNGPFFVDLSSRPYVMLQVCGYSHGIACWISGARQGQRKHLHSNNSLLYC